MPASRLLVPVSESVTLRQTVAFAVREARDRAEAEATEATVHFVYPLAGRLGAGNGTGRAGDARALLDRVVVWAEEDLGEDRDAVVLESALIGTTEYLFSPGDYADVLGRYARDHDLDSAVFDPEFIPAGTVPLLPPLESELRRSGIHVEEAPVTRDRRGVQLVRRGTVGQFLLLFGSSYGFYLLLAGSLATFELVTGAISAGVVAVALWRVSLTGPVNPSRTVAQVARLALYTPYLLWEIAKANVHISYVVLHPSLPIDPKVIEYDAAVWSPVPVATLANSITLTPGTLTIDVEKRHFVVHTLTANARASLLSGGLERAVRFVFYGRAAARTVLPAERAEDAGGES